MAHLAGHGVQVGLHSLALGVNGIELVAAFLSDFQGVHHVPLGTKHVPNLGLAQPLGARGLGALELGWAGQGRGTGQQQGAQRQESLAQGKDTVGHESHSGGAAPTVDRGAELGLKAPLGPGS